MSWLRKRFLLAYTDGCCLKNPGGPGGWAYVITSPETGEKKVGFGSHPSTTNNRMEMTAVLEALKSLPHGSYVTVRTDSTYVQKGMNHGINVWKSKDWKTTQGKDVVNRDLWEAISLQMDQHLVSVLWVRGHSGSIDNEHCDYLAGKAAKDLRKEMANYMVDESKAG